MILRTFWVWLKDETWPECELGWSQWSIDNYPDDWKRAKQERLDVYGDNVDSHREIDLRVDDDAILKHWWPDPTDAEVVAP